jgi:hypothetical protein
VQTSQRKARETIREAFQDEKEFAERHVQQNLVHAGSTAKRPRGTGEFP